MADEYWKERFTDTTRNVAFNLSISRTQCKVLVRLQVCNNLRKEKDTIVLDSLDEGYYPATALERKGLVQHNGDYYEITKAGKLVIQLLELAFSKKELDEFCKIRKITMTQVKSEKILEKLKEE